MSELRLAQLVLRASEAVLRQQQQTISVPRRFQYMIRDIWELQNRLVQMNRRQAIHCLHHSRFRAAYDFLLLRARIEPTLASVATFWTELQELPEDQRKDRRSHEISKVHGHRHRIPSGLAQGRCKDLDDPESKGDFRNLAFALDVVDFAVLIHALSLSFC